jgi:hypothetical protein
MRTCKLLKHIGNLDEKDIPVDIYLLLHRVMNYTFERYFVHTFRQKEPDKKFILAEKI